MKNNFLLLILISIMSPLAEAKTKADTSVHVYKVKKSFTGRVSVELPRMNVVYCGVDNPVIINVPGYSNYDVRITEGQIQRRDATYVLNVSKPGPVEVSIHTKAGKLIDSRMFRAKRIPDPVATVGGVFTGGAITKNELLAGGALIPLLKNFEFELFLEIMSFQILIAGKKIDTYVEDATGNQLTERMKLIIEKLPVGSIIRFEYIRSRFLKGGDSSSRTLPAMEFVLR